MPPLAAIAAFAAASVVLIVIPGPSVLFAIGRSLALGRRGGLLTVLGNEIGCLPLIAAVAFGVGTIVAESILLFSIIKFLGAAYLVYLGIQTIRHRKAGIDDEKQDEARPVSSWKILRQGFVVGITNPKTIVFFVAVLPQFVNIHAKDVSFQMIFLGLIFTAIALISDSAWALAAGTARGWFAKSPKRLAAVRATGGGLIIGLGGALALTGEQVMAGLDFAPALTRPELLASSVTAVIQSLPADTAEQILVAPIDPTLADTAAFCEAYDQPLDASANCIVVAGKRADVVSYAACVVLATTRADVNGVVRRLLNARGASFAPTDEAVRLTGMEYGGITPIGLPADWRVLVDERVLGVTRAIIGSGIRGSKLFLPGHLFAELPGIEIIPDLARE